MEKLRGVQTWITIPEHKKLTLNARQYGISLKEFVKELIAWGNKQNKEDLIRSGIRLPIWPEDNIDTKNRR